MLSHSVAMLIASNKSEFGEFPAAGTEWRWGDVVDIDGTGDGVSRSVAQRARRRDLVSSVGDGYNVTTRKLEEYLQAKHGIELTGHRDDDDPDSDEGQPTLTIDVHESTRTGSASDVCRDDDGEEDEDEVPA